jgi:hypothetical protein
LTTPSISNIDAKGDLLAGTADNTIGRLAVGTNGQVLTADSAETTGMKWATPASGVTFSGVDVKRASNNYSIPNATDTTMLWDSEFYDTDSYHSTVTNTSRLTVPTGKTGYYLLVFDIRWDTSGSGRRASKIMKNGTTQVLSGECSNIGFPTINASAVLYLTADDYLEASVFQSSGGALNIIEMNEGSAHFSLQYLGA